jgi:hypothetical protein
VRRERARLEPDRLPAPRPRLVEQEPEPAADVEQAAARRVVLDHVQRALSGGALPGLLGLVRVGGRGLVGGGQRRLIRHRVQLAVAAHAAAGDVGQRGAEAIGGGDEAVGAHLAGHAQVRAQAARTARGAAPGDCVAAWTRCHKMPRQ